MFNKKETLNLVNLLAKKTQEELAKLARANSLLLDNLTKNELIVLLVNNELKIGKAGLAGARTDPTKMPVLFQIRTPGPLADLMRKVNETLVGGPNPIKKDLPVWVPNKGLITQRFICCSVEPSIIQQFVNHGGLVTLPDNSPWQDIRQAQLTALAKLRLGSDDLETNFVRVRRKAPLGSDRAYNWFTQLHAQEA